MALSSRLPVTPMSPAANSLRARDTRITGATLLSKRNCGWVSVESTVGVFAPMHRALTGSGLS